MTAWKESCCYKLVEILLPLVKVSEENTERFLYTLSLPGSLLCHNSKTNFISRVPTSRPRSGFWTSLIQLSSTLKEIKLTLDNHQNLMITSQRSSEGMPTDNKIGTKACKSSVLSLFSSDQCPILPTVCPCAMRHT